MALDIGIGIGIPLLGAGGGSWVPLSPGGVVATLDLDFANNQGSSSGAPIAPASALTTTRASVAYEDDASGNWTQFAANTARITNKGLLVEETRTNVALWCRDLTNAAWVKTSATAALNQVGIDNSANAASTITATGASATVLQSITLASSARMQSAFIKRIVGAGVVNMTMDGGATWTAIPVTAAWTRLSVPTQTIANPQVGFQIVASGDSIAVDFVQNENGTFTTSPILTTTAAVTRNADVITVTAPPAFGSAYTLFGAGTPNAPINYATNQDILRAADAGVSNRSQIGRISVNGTAHYLGALAGSNYWNIATGTGLWSPGVFGKIAAAFAANDQAGTWNGLNLVTNGSGTPASAALTALSLGGSDALNSFWNGYITRIAVWPNNRVSNSQLQAITT